MEGLGGVGPDRIAAAVVPLGRVWEGPDLEARSAFSMQPKSRPRRQIRMMEKIISQGKNLYAVESEWEMEISRYLYLYPITQYYDFCCYVTSYLIFYLAHGRHDTLHTLSIIILYLATK